MLQYMKKLLGIKYIKIALILVFLFLIYVFIATPAQITDDYMSPSLHKGDNVLFLSTLIAHPKRGDIIDYKVEGKSKLQHARIIGIPGDKVIIKDGFVYLNGHFLEEAYIQKPRTTWVNDDAILGKNCQEVKIPDDKYFTLTDVRGAGTYGSLAYGLVDNKDIKGVKFWTYFPLKLSVPSRDTSNDIGLVGKISLDKATYLKLLNQERAKNNVKLLLSNDDVNKVAELALIDIIDQKEFNSMAKLDESIQHSISKVGYKTNSLISYFPSTGYFDAESLLQYWMSDDNSKKAQLDPDKTILGESSQVVEVNGCPQQFNLHILFSK